MDETTTPDVTPAAPTSAPVATAVETTPSAPVSTPTATPTSAPVATDGSGPAGNVTAGAPPASSTATAEAKLGAATTAAEVRAAIAEYEALNGDETIKLRGDLKIPVGKDGQMLTLEELRRSPLLQADYTRKTMEVAEQRRAMERDRVEMEARAKQHLANIERLQTARRQGGEALERELLHQDLLQNDPEYAKRFEESEEFRVQQAVNAHEGEKRQIEDAQYTAQNAREYIASACAQHPELDPQEIEAAYANALKAGRAELRSSSVDRVIAQHLQRAQRVQQPLRTELEALRAELAALRADTSVSAGNAAVAAAIGKTKAPAVGRPAAGGVPVPQTIQPFRPGVDDPAEYKRRWRASA